MKPDNSQRTFATRPIRFQLVHIFALMLGLAVWLAVLQSYRNLGIVLGVSLLPGAITLAVLRTFWRRSVSRRPVITTSLSLVTISCIWFGIYVLSMGPVVAFAMSTDMDDSAIRSFYDPVRVLQFHTPLFRYIDPVLDWTTNLWGWN